MIDYGYTNDDLFDFSKEKVEPYFEPVEKIIKLIEQIITKKIT